MSSAPRRLAILSLTIVILAIGLDYASAEECDYKRCGTLMVRDGSTSWGLSGPRDYSPDTKRACAELNACLRRAKSNFAARAAAAAAPASGSSAKSSPKESATNLNPEPAEKAAKVMQPAATSAVRENSGHAFPNADHSNGKPTRCFAVAEILVAVDCPPDGPQ